MNKLLLLFSILIVLGGCRSSKINKPIYTKAPKVSALINSINAQNFKFNTMSAKISGKYSSDNQSFSFKGNIKIQNDSVLWVTISPGLGLELGRILIDKDSLRFINRFDKTYYKNSLKELSKKFKTSLSFNEVKSLLIGNLISGLDFKKYYSYIEEQKFILCSVSYKQLKKIERSRRQPDLEILKTIINPENSKIYSQEIKNYKLNKHLSVNYQDFEKHNKLWLAESIEIKLSSNENMILNLSFSKINLNKTLKFPFSVPSSYEVIE